MNNSKRMESNESEMVNEDPFLLDDPGGSPMEWLDFNVTVLRQAVRRSEAVDPWSRTDHSAENDALTERRRRKLQALSLNRDDKLCDDLGASVA